MSRSLKSKRSARWIRADAIFDGTRLLRDVALHLEEGVVAEIADMSTLADETPVEVFTGLVTPGFFDIQVNGGGGVLLNTTPTAEGIATIMAAHREFGTTAMLPTVISDRPEVLEAAADAAISARHQDGMMGLHIEGPHISHEKRGTHDPSALRALDEVTLDLVQRLNEADVPVLITVAPEAATPSDIGQLTERGAVVSIGHSNANCDDALALIAAGATGFTHLYNAMSQLEGRKPGVVGAALASDAWCSVIADGHHVAPESIALAFKAKSDPERMIVISDAMPTVGGPKEFFLYGQHIQINSGKLVNSDGALAGAHLTMIEALRNLVEWGIPLETALRAGRKNPAQFMGLEAQMGLIGCNACDLLHLTEDLYLKSVGLE